MDEYMSVGEAWASRIDAIVNVDDDVDNKSILNLEIHDKNSR